MSKNKVLAIVAIGSILNSGLWFSESAVSAVSKLRPSQPVIGQTLSDEQQGVLAVRSVKPAVVSIIGSSKLPNSEVRSESSFGTGFIIASDGYIVTNSHVVEDVGETHIVQLLDGKQFPARIVGMSKFDDIALLKIDAGSLATVKFGNSDILETGQTVFGIGNALGKYQHSVTRGVVSGLDRSVSFTSPEDMRPRFRNLIQTDAAVNKGNSGGPLITMTGEVIGMNVLVENGQSVNFAIPANHIQTIIQQLKTTGSVHRPQVGIVFAPNNAALQALEKLPTSSGALITHVGDNSAAAKAGLKPKDIVLLVEGKPVGENAPLDDVILNYKPGDTVWFKVQRGNQVLDIPVVLGEYQ